MSYQQFSSMGSDPIDADGGHSSGDSCVIRRAFQGCIGRRGGRVGCGLTGGHSMPDVMNLPRSRILEFGNY